MAETLSFKVLWLDAILTSINIINVKSVKSVKSVKNYV